MIYVYDTVLAPYEETIKRYGGVYRLENRTRMGEQVFYMFHSSGREKILVVPRFAEQYRELEKKYEKITTFKSLETCIKHIKKEISREIIQEEYPSDESETGKMAVLNVDYKDIRVQFEFYNSHLRLGNEFEILNNNIFGNGVIVTMNMDMEA